MPGSTGPLESNHEQESHERSTLGERMVIIIKLKDRFEIPEGLDLRDLSTDQLRELNAQLDDNVESEVALRAYIPDLSDNNVDEERYKVTPLPAGEGEILDAAAAANLRKYLGNIQYLDESAQTEPFRRKGIVYDQETETWISISNDDSVEG